MPFCSVLQSDMLRSAAPCITLQHTWIHCISRVCSLCVKERSNAKETSEWCCSVWQSVAHHSATHCRVTCWITHMKEIFKVRETYAMWCISEVYCRVMCNTLQHPASLCNTPQSAMSLTTQITLAETWRGDRRQRLWPYTRSMCLWCLINKRCVLFKHSELKKRMSSQKIVVSQRTLF